MSALWSASLTHWLRLCTQHFQCPGLGAAVIGVMAVRPPRALSEVVACSNTWGALSSSAREGLVRKKLASTVLFACCFDGSVDESHELALEIGGTEDDIPHLVALWELAGVAANYDKNRLASVSVLDVSVSSAIDARTRGGERSELQSTMVSTRELCVKA